MVPWLLACGIAGLFIVALPLVVIDALVLTATVRTRRIHMGSSVTMSGPMLTTPHLITCRSVTLRGQLLHSLRYARPPTDCLMSVPTMMAPACPTGESNRIFLSKRHRFCLTTCLIRGLRLGRGRMA